MGKKGKKKQRAQIQGQRMGKPAHEYQKKRPEITGQTLLKFIRRYFELKKQGKAFYLEFSPEELQFYSEVIQIPNLDQRIAPAELPSNIVLANRSRLLNKHPHYASYSGYPWYYQDYAFKCQACGQPQLWTAAQQKWWYEEIGGNLYSTAKYCRPCRQKSRENERSKPILE